MDSIVVTFGLRRYPDRLVPVVLHNHAVRKIGSIEPVDAHCPMSKHVVSGPTAAECQTYGEISLATCRSSLSFVATLDWGLGVRIRLSPRAKVQGFPVFGQPPYLILYPGLSPIFCSPRYSASPQAWPAPEIGV